jgi:hypothetical protein
LFSVTITNTANAQKTLGHKPHRFLKIGTAYRSREL